MYLIFALLFSFILYTQNAIALSDGDPCIHAGSGSFSEHKIFYCDGSNWHLALTNQTDGIVADTVTATKFIGDGSGLTNVAGGLWTLSDTVVTGGSDTTVKYDGNARLESEDSIFSALIIGQYGSASPILLFEDSRGTKGSPEASGVNDRLFTIQSRGYDV